MKARILLLSLLIGSAAWANTPVAGDKRVIARQGGVELTVEDFHAAMHEIPLNDRTGFAQDPQRLTRMVSNALRAKYLAAQAEKSGAMPPYFEARMNSTRNRILAEFQIQALRERIEVPDLTQAAREKFLVNRKAYDVPETGAIRYIALSIGKRGEEAARTLAIQLSEQANAGEDFESLIKQHTDEPESLANERGWLPEYALDAEPAPDDTLAQVMVGLKPGEVAKPFKQRNNYYVAKLLSRAPSRPATFEEVRDQIVSGLQAEYLSTKLQEKLADYEAAPLEVDEAVLPYLRDEYAQPQPQN